eukprot:sb/3479112/
MLCLPLPFRSVSNLDLVGHVPNSMSSSLPLTAPRYVQSDPDLPVKTLTPEDPGKSGSDCRSAKFLSVLFEQVYPRLKSQTTAGVIRTLLVYLTNRK